MTAGRPAPRRGTCLFLATLFALPGLFAAADEQSGIAERHRWQMEAVVMARQLIADVLDVQLRQLADNRLESLAIYQDIHLTRSQLSAVAEQDMLDIARLLEQARDASGARRDTLIQDARAEARDVVAILVAEQQRLGRRLKIGRVHAQLTQLIDHQRRVRSDTERLPTLTFPERDQATLQTLEDQRDVRSLFQQLLGTLDEIRQWENPESVTAAKVQQALQGQSWNAWFGTVELQLRQGEAAQATSYQDKILEGLAAALREWESAQGWQPFDQTSLRERVSQLLETQRRLAEETRQVEQRDAGRLEALSQRQRDILDGLHELDATDRVPSTASPLLQQAASAAFDAEAALFTGQPDTAGEHQQQVVLNLEQLDTLLQAAEDEHAQLRTDQQDSAQQQLRQLGLKLDEFAQLQQEVLRQMLSDAATARQLEEQIAAGLEREAGRQPLPSEVRDAVAQAAALAQKTARMMQSASPGAETRRSAAQVQQAIEAARSLAAMRSNAARPINMQAKEASDGADRSAAEMPAGERQTADGQTPDTDNANEQATASQRLAGDAERAERASSPGERPTGAHAPWFARLPTELREALRVQGRPQPPRGYEKRLQRYFESVDN